MLQAVTVSRRRIEVSEIDAPNPGPGEALVQVDAVGVCGGDLHLFVGDDPYSNFPLRQGHEYAGTIVEFGPGYAGDLRVGDLVAVEPLIPDGQCLACRRGHPNCCRNLKVQGAHVPGALCEFMAVGTEHLFSADGLQVELAAFVEPMSIGAQMIVRSAVQPGDRAVVFGAGPIGQAVLLAGRSIGAEWMVVDQVPSRLELARGSGANEVVDASSESVIDRIQAWTDDEGPAVVFEATGVVAVLRQALDVVANSGTVVVAGTPDGEITFPVYNIIVRKELNLLGSRNNAGVFGEAVEIVRREAAQVERLITHRYPLERVGEAMEFAIANPAMVEKVVIRPPGPGRSA